MKTENVKTELTGMPKKGGKFGGTGGKEFNDITYLLELKDELPNLEIERIIIRSGDRVDSIQVEYKNIAPCPRHGQEGGKESVIEFNPGDEIIGMKIRHGNRIDKLTFWIYTPSLRKIKTYEFGGNGGKEEIAVLDSPIIAFYGRCGKELDALGLYLR